MEQDIPMDIEERSAGIGIEAKHHFIIPDDAKGIHIIVKNGQITIRYEVPKQVSLTVDV